jgi:hypothetical protein
MTMTTVVHPSAPGVLRRMPQALGASLASPVESFLVRGQSRVATRRKRITPFQAKRVAERQQWRCAMCGELLQEDFEVDHIESPGGCK